MPQRHPEGQVVPDTSVREIMSHPVTTVEPQRTVEECIAVMTDKRSGTCPCSLPMSGRRRVHRRSRQASLDEKDF